MRTADLGLDPLISASDGEPKGSRSIRNRRHSRMFQSERWGCILFGVLSVCICFFIYLYLFVIAWPANRPSQVVNVPPADDSLPGPKGN